MSPIMDIQKTTEDNPILDPLIASLGESVDKVGDAKTLEIPLSAQDLLPTNRSVFYRYAGSLTTPPCSESVEWTVLYRTVGASERQLEKFRTVNSDEGRDIKYNYRPTQPQHDRKIFFVQSSQYLAVAQDDGSNASRIRLAPWVLIVVMGLVFRH
uniref:carbonic anhydrase n=1 Tax=Cacopsylla melanoneura TaxID=428564 RepID=A0A8D9ABJ5_9HEMI